MQESQKMSLEYYAKNYDKFVDALSKKGVNQHEHAAYGILSEVGEIASAIKRHKIYETPLDRENILEELGDIRFFLQMDLNLLGIDIHNEDLNNQLALEVQEWPAINDSNLFSALKSLLEFEYDISVSNGDSILYGRRDALDIWCKWQKLCAYFKFHPLEVINYNVVKLMKRYPSMEYSNEDALARADKQ